MALILIIDDDKMMCDMLTAKFSSMGHQTDYCHTLADGLAQAGSAQYDLVFLDVGMPDGSGLDVLPELRNAPGQPEVIIITGLGDPEGAEMAIRSGAWDYIEKGSSLKQITLPLTRALQYRQEKMANRPMMAIKREAIIGNSPAMQACFNRLAQAAASDANVLIMGETGTGKELFARAVHENSSRAGQSYVVVDCAALPESLVENLLFGHAPGAFTGAEHSQEGLIRQAHRGTLFLDEVGELPLTLQRPSYACCKSTASGPWAAAARWKATSGWWRPPTATWTSWWPKVVSGRTCCFACARSPSSCRRCASAWKTSRNWSSPISPPCASATASRARASTPSSWRPWPTTTGRAMCASCSTPWSGPSPPPATPHPVPQGPAQQRAYRGHPLATQRPRRRAGGRSPAPPLGSVMPEIRTYLKTINDQMERGYLQELMLRTKGDIKRACQMSGLSRTGLYDRLKSTTSPAPPPDPPANPSPP